MRKPAFSAPLFASLDAAAPAVVRPSPIVEPEPALPVREVLDFDARLFLALPLPTSLLCTLAHGGGRLVVTISSASPAGAGDVQAPVFVGPEFLAMVRAAEHDRGTHVTVAAWCARKTAEPTWRLTTREVLGGVFDAPESTGWTVGRVLRSLGVRLDEVFA